MTKATKAATPKPIAKKAIKPLTPATKTPPKRRALLHTYGSELFEQSSVVLLVGCTPASLKQSALDYEAKLKAIQKSTPPIEITKVAAYLAAYVDALAKSLGQCALTLNDKTKNLDIVESRLPEILKEVVKGATFEMVSRLDAKEKVKVSIKSKENAVISADVRSKANREAAPHIYEYWKKERKPFSSDKEFSAHAKNKYQKEHAISIKLSAIEAMCRAWKAGTTHHGIPIAK